MHMTHYMPQTPWRPFHSQGLTLHDALTTVSSRVLREPAAVSRSVLRNLSFLDLLSHRRIKSQTNIVKLYSHFSIPNGINSPRESGNDQYSDQLKKGVPYPSLLGNLEQIHPALSPPTKQTVG